MIEDLQQLIVSVAIDLFCLETEQFLDYPNVM